MRRSNRLFMRMVAKVLDVLFKNPIPNPPPRYQEKLGELQELNGKARTLVAMGSDGDVTATREAANKRTARDVLYEDHLIPIRETARALEPEIPNILKTFPLPHKHTPVEKIAGKARTIAANAQNHRDLFIALGHPETFVEDLHAAIAEYERSSSGKVGGIETRVDARLELEQLMVSIRKVLRYLDTIFRRRFKGNVAKLALWKYARTQDDEPTPSKPEQVVPAPKAAAPGRVA
jgi:hypothetical protein